VFPCVPQQGCAAQARQLPASWGAIALRERGSPEEGLQAGGVHFAPGSHAESHAPGRQSHGDQWRGGSSSRHGLGMFGPGGKESVPLPAQPISDGGCRRRRGCGRILSSFWPAIARLGPRGAAGHQERTGATGGKQRGGDRCGDLDGNHLRIMFSNIFDLFNSPHRHAHRHKEHAHPRTRIFKIVLGRILSESKMGSLIPRLTFVPIKSIEI